METIGNFIISNSFMVIGGLGGSIILCVFGLLLISFHSPQDAIASEVGTVDRIEGVLRQILSEQDWPAVKTGSPTPVEGAAEAAPDATPTDGASAPSESMASSPDAPAAEPAVAAAPAVDVAPLENKIKELEEKLAEYSVIEEDIADLSRFRQENDELRKKISHATGVAADEAVSMPWDDFEAIVKGKTAGSIKDSVATSIEKT